MVSRYCMHIMRRGATAEAIGRTPDASPPAVEDLGVNHRCAHVLVPKEFLHGTDTAALNLARCRRVSRYVRNSGRAISHLGARYRSGFVPRKGMTSRHADNAVIFGWFLKRVK